MTHEHDELTLAGVKVLIIWIITLIAHNIDSILHTILALLSIAYLIWKWVRDYKKSKLEKYGKS